MNKALGLSPAQYGVAARIFFFGYLVAPLPSVMLLERFGVEKWVFAITFLWGVGATSLAFIHSHGAF